MKFSASKESKSQLEPGVLNTGSSKCGTGFALSSPATTARGIPTRGSMMSDKTFRMVTRGPDGEVRTRDYDAIADIEQQHDQIGIDDCSTDLTLRGLPVFRGLIGPIPEGKDVVRYESPEVFEALTKEWSNKKTKRRRRKSSPVPAPHGVPATQAVPSETTNS